MKKTILAAALCLGLGLPLAASAPVLAQPAVAGQLSDQQLKEMLDNMGYEPKTLGKGVLVTIKLDTMTVNMQLVLSPDQTKIGMNANLGVISKPEAVPPANWQTLLVDNGNIDPSAFYFDKDQKKLYLHRAIDNVGLTPARLKSQVDHFANNVKDTQEDWKFTD